MHTHSSGDAGVGRLLLAPLLAALLVACGHLAVDGESTPRVNAPEQRDKPYLVLVSIDGFRWDFAERYGARHIASIGVRGLQADALQPVFPTLTFPNHFSIATGQPPARHGLVANEFPSDDRSRWFVYKDRTTVQDGGWYLAEPIWVTAEKRGMLTAAYYFVGTEADVGGVRPTHWHAFDADVDGERRVSKVLDWLGQPVETRPHLVTLYFEDVDDYTHWHGPGSPESRAAIRRVDDQVGQLLRDQRRHPVWIVFVMIKRKLNKSVQLLFRFYFLNCQISHLNNPELFADFFKSHEYKV